MKIDQIAEASFEQRSLRAPDGHDIAVLHLRPASVPARATAQIVHGLAEHASRYERFADYLTRRGFAVFAHNHRGHGPDMAAEKMGHFADDDGWHKVLGDVAQVHQLLRQEHGQLPHLLFGHSMGSYVVQAFIMRNPQACDALVLSGSTHAPRLKLYLGRLAARIEIWRHGRGWRSTALNAQAFGAFNKRFEPARTEFDWLSRDAVEVDRYIADPACGFIPSAGLWHDLLGGMLAIGRKTSLQRVPTSLPILIMGGSDDPVGGSRGMQRLLHAYQNSGHQNVDIKIYEGGRHEMLNEINRLDVMRDIAAWAKSVLPERQPSS